MVLAMIWLPSITNHTEAEDAYSYALAAEEFEYSQLLHPHHRLYHPLSKFVYECSGVERSFEVLQVLSGVFSTIAIWLFYLLLGRLGVQSLATKGAYLLILAGSYGFWRYAREVEIYPMAWATLLFAVYWLTGPIKGRRFWIGLAVLLVFSINVHKALIVPLGVMAAVKVVASQRWRPGILCALAAGLLFLGTEKAMLQIQTEGWAIAPEKIENPFAAAPSNVARPSKRLRISSIPKGLIGFGSSVVATFPVMSFDPLYRWLQYELFPYRNFHEERFLVENLPIQNQVIWIIGLILLFVSIGLFLWSVFEKRKESSGIEFGPKAVVNFGCLAFMVLILIFEPGNPEMWLIGLPLIVATVVVHFPSANVRALWFIALSLIFVNWVGGMTLMNQDSRNYDRKTGAVLLQNEFNQDDVYLIGATVEVHGHFARYISEVTVIRGSFGPEYHDSLFKLLEEILDRGGRFIMHSTAWSSTELSAIQLFELGLLLVHDEESGAVELIR